MPPTFCDRKNDMEITPEANARLTSRKFILSLVVLAVASAFLAFRVIEPLLWRDIVIAVLGGYLTSNLVQKTVASKSAAS